jgi:hypothetical protein
MPRQATGLAGFEPAIRPSSYDLNTIRNHVALKQAPLARLNGVFFDRSPPITELHRAKASSVGTLHSIVHLSHIKYFQI